MGVESQVVDFVMNLTLDKFKQQADEAEGYFDDLAKSSKTAFKRGLAENAARAFTRVGHLVEKVKELTQPFVEHVQTMETYRKETGMTAQETHDFSEEVVRATARYGIALNRVGMIATFVSKGLKKGHAEVVRMAGSLSDLGDTTGLTDETARDLAFTLTRQFGVAAPVATKQIHVLAAAARQAKVPLEDVASVLAENTEALRFEEIGVATRQLGSLATSLLEVGATKGQVSSVVGAISDLESGLRLRVDAQGLPQVMQTLAVDVGRIREQERKGQITHHQYERSMQKLSSTYGVGVFELEKLEEAGVAFSRSQVAMDEARAKSLIELEAENQERASAMTKFHKRGQHLMAGLNKTFNELWGPNAAIWGGLGEASDWAMDKAEELVEIWKEVEPILSVVLKTIDELVHKSAVERITEHAKGLGVKPGAAYDQATKGDPFSQRQLSAPVSSAPSPQEQAKNDTKNTQAMKDVGNAVEGVRTALQEMNRQTGNARFQDTSRGRSRSTNLYRTVTG